MDKNESHEQLELSDLREIYAVQALICKQMELQGYGSRDVFSVRLAIDESLNNAIRHGHCLDSSKTVRVSYRVDEDQVWLRVEDEGTGFHLPDVPDPTLEDFMNQPGGRGVFVMRRFMCSVTYNEQGNQVTMCKRRSQAPIEGILGL